jgi:rhamnulokinase
MTKPREFMAIDLGAESGRAILGALGDEQLTLSQVHRFANEPVRLPDGLHWDVLRLWAEIKSAIALAVRQHGKQLAGIGIDTWGVDFALLDRQGMLLMNPYHFRDSRTDGMLEEAFRRMPRKQIFELTGIQFMPFNTLYQLLSMTVNQSPVLEVAQAFLTMPDLINYWLSGQKACEFSNATTTQCFDPRRRIWADPLLEIMNIPTQIFPEVVEPGTVLGGLSPLVAEEIGGTAAVIAPACHDTGSAVAAVPAQGQNFVWISSGTWSIMGTELREPIINQASLDSNFTNEGGVNGTFRFSKNIAGLWLAQESRRTWAAEGEDLSYSDLTQMASQADRLVSVIDPDCLDFIKPGDMPARIRAFCQRTGQPVPHSKGAIIRCVLEGLALKYRWVLERLEEIVGRPLAPIHIVGGGAQNRLLNQFTADATGRPVVAGPVEATAIGNILMQALALGQINSLKDARAVVRQSFVPDLFEPIDQAGWDDAYERLLQVMK